MNASEKTQEHWLKEIIPLITHINTLRYLSSSYYNCGMPTGNIEALEINDLPN